MSEQGYPVSVRVGSQLVRIGTAYREGEGFTLSLGSVIIGTTADAPSTQRRASSGDSGAFGGTGEGICLPNYGRSKGAPVRGASLSDLEFYKRGCERSLNDPSKSRWHDRERQLLSAIDAEIVRQQGGGETGGSPAADDDSELPF